MPLPIFSHIFSTFKAVVFGILIFIASFPFLFWVENRENLSEHVQNAKETTAAEIQSLSPNPLIKITGELRTQESINDPRYLTPKSQAHLYLKRQVEMYAWKEIRKKNSSGTKGYRYVKSWERKPKDASRFKEPSGHENPQMFERPLKLKVYKADVAGVFFDAHESDYYGAKPLTMIATDMQTSRSFLNGHILYLPYDQSTDRNPMRQPKVGDLRMTYTHVANGVNGTVVGSWDGQKIYRDANQKNFLGVYPGSADEFYEYLQRQHRWQTLTFRVLSFVMMWVGLLLMLRPLTLLTNAVPLLGTAGNFTMMATTILIAAALWLTTFLLAAFWIPLFIIAAVVLIYMAMKEKS